MGRLPRHELTRAAQRAQVVGGRDSRAVSLRCALPRTRRVLRTLAAVDLSRPAAHFPLRELLAASTLDTAQARREGGAAGCGPLQRAAAWEPDAKMRFRRRTRCAWR